MNSRWRICWGLFLAAGLATGCLRLGPEYERPQTRYDLPNRYLQDKASPETRAYCVAEKWWRQFNDPCLNQVVQKVLGHNPDIQKAAARVLEARAVAAQVDADRYPALNLEGRASRQKQTVTNSLTGQAQTQRSNTYSLSLPASFELDLWGRLARASQAARADLLAAENNRRTVRQSLIAEAVSGYFRLQSWQRQLALARRLTRTHQENLELVQARYRRGLTSVLEVRQARRSLAQSKAEVPTLVDALGRARQTLAVLQGDYPRAEGRPVSASKSLDTLDPVPAGLPADLLNRRPDIRAAEAQLAAASARIGVAKAARLPQISLTGSLGYTSDELDLLLKPDSQLWQIAVGVLQPLFDAGRRKNVQQAAEARYQQQRAVYAKTVLNALAEVEGALLTRKQKLKRYRRLQELKTEAEATLQTAQDRYQRGLSDYLKVLDAQQVSYQAALNLVKTRYDIYLNRVALYRSLGGGWPREATSND